MATGNDFELLPPAGSGCMGVARAVGIAVELLPPAGSVDSVCKVALAGFASGARGGAFFFSLFFSLNFVIIVEFSKMHCVP